MYAFNVISKSKIIIIALGFCIFSACAGRQQAIQLTENMQKANGDYEVEINRFIDGMIKIEKNKIDGVDAAISVLEQGHSNENELTTSCLSKANDLFSRLAKSHDATVKEVYKNSIESGKNLRSEFYKASAKITDKLQELDKTIHHIVKSLKNGTGDGSSATDLARLKTTHLALYIFYSELLLDQMEKIDTKITDITLSHINQLNTIRADIFNKVSNDALSKCKSSNRDFLAIQSQMEIQLLLTLSELKKANNTNALKDIKKGVSSVFEANRNAAKSMKNYLKYNSLSEGSGAYEFGKSVPKGLISGFISPSSSPGQDLIKKDSKNLLDNLKQEFFFDIDNYRQAINSLKNSHKGDISKAISNTISDFEKKILEKIN